MIIECTECQKQYYLDDTKITPQGIRIRCTQCNNVFSVRSYDAIDRAQQQPTAMALPKQQLEDIKTDSSLSPLLSQDELAGYHITSLSTTDELHIPDAAFLQEEAVSYSLAKALGAEEDLSTFCSP